MNSSHTLTFSFPIRFTFIVILFHAVPLVGAGVNLVPNGSFENVSGNRIEHWETNLDISNRDTSRAFNGEASLKLVGDGSSNYCAVQPSPVLKPNTEYVLRYWVDASQVKGAKDSYIRIRYVDLRNSTVQTFGHENAWSFIRRTRDWILIEQVFTTARELDGVRLDLMWSLRPGDVAWVDHISLSEVGTSGEPEDLWLLTQTEEVASDGRGLLVAEVRVVDEAGNPVASAEGDAMVALAGPGRILQGGSVRIHKGSGFIHYRGTGEIGAKPVLQTKWKDFESFPLTVRLIEPSRAPTPDTFLYGFFEDGNLVWNDSGFSSMLEKIRDRSDYFNIIILTNGGLDRTTPLFEIADSMGFSLLQYPARNLFEEWFENETIEMNLESAKQVMAPIVEAWKDQPAHMGYYVYDEPPWHQLEANALAISAFRDLDPVRPAMSVLNNGDGNPHMFDTSEADILLTDPYPVRGNTTVGSWTEEFAKELRSHSRTLPPGYPYWIILQTHGSENPGNTGAAVRTPEPSEVKAQFWIAIGEGSDCITWFIFKTQQFWTGAEDNPPIFDATVELAERLKAFGSILPKLQKIEDRFEVTSTGERPYISTLYSEQDGNFVIIQNGDCLQPRELRVTSERAGNRGTLVSLENGRRYRLGEPIQLAPGDGSIFKYEVRSIP